MGGLVAGRLIAFRLITFRLIAFRLLAFLLINCSDSGGCIVLSPFRRLGGWSRGYAPRARLERWHLRVAWALQRRTPYTTARVLPGAGVLAGDFGDSSVRGLEGAFGRAGWG